MAAHRPMTVPERYYTFLDRRWRTNPMISADLDVCFDAAFVEQRWQEYRSRRVLGRAVATEDLALLDPGVDVDGYGPAFSSVDLPARLWDRTFDDEATWDYPVTLPMRLRYLRSPEEGRSRLILVGHHSMIDGRIGLTELQALIRIIDGQDVPEQQELSEPPPETAPAYPWQESSRQRLDLLRAIKARSVEIGPTSPATWFDVDLPRKPRIRQWIMEPEEVDRFVAAGRSHGSSVSATVAAALMATVAEKLCRAAPVANVQLAMPADISVPSNDPRRPTAMAVPVLSHPYRVDVGDVWGLAKDVVTTVRTALQQGEGPLFFNLTRVGAAPDLEAGAAMVGTALAAGPPCVVLSNMGLVDPGSDPEWVHSLQGQLAPAPNQVVFASTLSYRGRLVHTISTDDCRIPLNRAAELVANYRQRVAALSA